jgi:hypothetical protein
MTGYTIVVAGLGRCGTSLLMRMLDVAGVPTIGSAPDWESIPNLELLQRDRDGWAAEIESKAVKLLDAHRYVLPSLSNARMIWLARDPREQARSMIKLMNATFRSMTADRSSVRRMAAGIKRDTTPASSNVYGAVGGKGIALTFERLISEPHLTASTLCQFLDLDHRHADKMAAQVVPRRPECLPYLMEAFQA